MRLKRSDIKNIIFAVIAVLLIAGNAVYYLRDFSKTVPLYHYGFNNQTMYNKSFFNQGIDQDAFIRMLIRNKKVIYARQIRPYNEYPSYGHEHEKGNPFSSEYYIENNYARYFDEYAASTEVDTSLPAMEDVKELMASKKTDFVYFNKCNDMLRYSFMVNKDLQEVNSYFRYSYIYYTVAGGDGYGLYYHTDDFLNMYICLDGIADADELIAVWDNTENIYLMPEKYYAENIAGQAGGTNAGK